MDKVGTVYSGTYIISHCVLS